MRVSILILFLLAAFPFFSFSQNSRLYLNLNDEIASGATLFCYQTPDTVPFIKKVIYSKDILELSSEKMYRVVISSVGKNNFDTLIHLRNSDITINVVLSNKISSLSAVTIVSKKPLIKEEDDKTVVDAASLTISSSNAMEVVEKTPGAIADADGNIYLNSTQPATVFINGREMKLSGPDMASLLKSLPASSVSKIEILRNPSAKYDAASSGGIINIILKKGVKLGSNGSINMAFFQGVYATKTAGFSFNKNDRRLSTYINYQYTSRVNYEDLISDRSFLNDGLTIMQSSFTKYPSKTHYISLGVEYTINKKWNTAFDLRYSYNENNNKATNSIGMVQHQTTIGQNLSIINNKNHTGYLSGTGNIKYKIDTIGSEWTQNLQYEYYNYQNTQKYKNDFVLPENRYAAGEGASSNDKNIFLYQSDVLWKCKKSFTIETGIKISSNKNQNTADYLKDTGNHILFKDTYQTNRYQYNEKIGAAYFQFSKTFFGFTLKPGLRFEITDIAGHQISPKDTAFSIYRKDIFPYIFLKHKLFSMFGQPLMASIIFRKSIKRPFFESLNPYPKYVDQYLYDLGNPVLKPQFTTNYECNVTFNDIPVLAIGLNQTKDIFTNVIYQDTTSKIAFRTFDNLGRNKEIYFRLITGIPPGKKYFFYLGGLYNYTAFDGYYQNQPFQYSRNSFTFFTFHEIKFNPNFTFNMQGFMRLKALQTFYELNTFGGAMVSANKSILKKKANIIFSVNDVLHTNQVAFTFNQNGQTITGKRINDTRRFGLTLRYNFGLKPKEEKKEMLLTDPEKNG
jgi:hypothetical protein